MLSSVVLLSALFAGVVAIAATAAIERFGGRIGGLLATLPSTIVPAALGIYAESVDPAAFQAALLTTPGGLLVDALFLASWRFLPPRFAGRSSLTQLGLIVAGSLMIWFAAAASLVLVIDWLAGRGLPMLAVGLGNLLVLLVFGVWSCRRAPRAPAGDRRVGAFAFLSRGLLAGFAIATAVWFAAIGGPLAAGVAAVFPAIFLTTMVSLWISQGPAVPVGAVGPMMLGSSSVAAFAILAALTMPLLGPATGCVVAWLGAALGFTWPAWRWLQAQR